MSLNRTHSFFLGALIAAIAFPLYVWVKTADFLREGAHEWEEGKVCGSLEHLFMARTLHKKDSSYYLGILFSTGECVQQNLPIAETYFRESEHTHAKDLGRLFFNMAETVMESHDDAIENAIIRDRVLKLLTRSKELKYVPSPSDKFRVSEKQKHFLLSFFEHRS